MKKIVAVILALMMLSAVAVAEGQLRVGLECNYAPFNWTQMDETNGGVPISGGLGFAGGYDVEIAKLLAEKLERELVIVKTEWDGLIPALQANMIDVVIAGMSPTAERKITVDFSEPYYNSDLVIVVRADSAYASATKLSDFAGAKITGQQNTFHYSVIDQIEGVIKQTAMPDFPTMQVALGSGMIDGYVSERPGAESACASNAGLSYVVFEAGAGFEASEEDTAVAVAVKKGQEDFVSAINAALAEIDDEVRVALMLQALENQPSAE